MLEQATGTNFIGDNSATTIQQASSDNRFAARFANGYSFFTSSDLWYRCSDE